MKRLPYILIALLCQIALVTGQEKKMERANKLYDSYAFSLAAEQYRELADEGYQSPLLYENLGNCYYYMSDLENAGKWYQKLMEAKTDVEPEYYFRYSHTLKANGDYKKANDMMDKFEGMMSKDERAILFEDNPNYLEIIQLRSGKARIKNENFNSPYPDFGPSYYKDGLIFASSRDTGTIRKRIHDWNLYPYLDLYLLSSVKDDSLGQLQKFSRALNTKYHECTPVFTKDGKTVYFTRNNYVNGKKGKDREGVIRLKILRAMVDQDGNWHHIEELPFNSNDYSVAHPALNPDNTKLYFASDMPGSLGQSDIYEVDINADGSLSEPKNLGTPINTEGRDTYPFISAKGNLFFASDGHPGLGGLDVYAVPMTDHGLSDQVVNLGSPLNSNEDDFSLVLDPTGLKGYFASNREGGHGSDDIYAVVFEESLFKCPAKGTVKNKETNAPLANAEVVVWGPSGKEAARTTSNNKGDFTVSLPCTGGKFKTVASKEGFLDQEQEVVLPRNEPIELFLELEKKPEAIGTDLAKTLKLAPIYFDLDKANIRPDAAIELQKVIHYLKEFPSVKIEVGSHTDSRGSDAYNLGLSDRRAKSTRRYLIEKGGIDPSRISGKGYGETKLINRCANGVKCSAQEHELNRRSEFIVVESSRKNE